MKKYIYALIIFLLLLFPSSVFAIVNPTNNFYINDYANILSSETEEYILSKSIALNNVDGTQIVVVTVPNLGGYSLEEYANELFNTWGIGSKDKNNGLLLLLALEEREFRVEVGDGLGGILPDGKTGRFQDDYIIPYLRNNDWDNGLKNGYDAFFKEVVKLNNLDIEYNEPIISNNENDNLFDILISVLTSIPLIGMFSGPIIKSLKKKPREIATKIYLLIWLISFLGAWFLGTMVEMVITLLIINLIFFLLGRFTSGSSSGSRGYSSRSSGSFRSSSSRSSGGGGRSSGGGSSRRF